MHVRVGACAQLCNRGCGRRRPACEAFVDGSLSSPLPRNLPSMTCAEPRGSPRGRRREGPSAGLRAGRHSAIERVSSAAAQLHVHTGALCGLNGVVPAGTGMRPSVIGDGPSPNACHPVARMGPSHRPIHTQRARPTAKQVAQQRPSSAACTRDQKPPSAQRPPGPLAAPESRVLEVGSDSALLTMMWANSIDLFSAWSRAARCRRICACLGEGRLQAGWGGAQSCTRCRKRGLHPGLRAGSSPGPSSGSPGVMAGGTSYCGVHVALQRTFTWLHRSQTAKRRRARSRWMWAARRAPPPTPSTSRRSTSRRPCRCWRCGPHMPAHAEQPRSCLHLTPSLLLPTVYAPWHYFGTSSAAAG
jgi:hypothetical protein